LSVSLKITSTYLGLRRVRRPTSFANQME
jgi:hypothetical protein